MYKPVHVITNDDRFFEKIQDEFQLGAEDFTEEEGLHYHYLLHWNIGANGGLSPTRQGAVKRWRNILVWGRPQCSGCYRLGRNTECHKCGLYYKFIWIAGEEHHENLHTYIERKIEADPTRNVDWVPETESESEEEDDE